MTYIKRIYLDGKEITLAELDKIVAESTEVIELVEVGTYCSLYFETHTYGTHN